MFEAMIHGLALVVHWPTFGYLLLGVLFGLWLGAVPGLGGVTGMVVLAESHMSIHTWPEKRYVTVDVYVCSYTQDNRPRARQLYQSLLDAFKPERENSHSVERL